METVFKIVTGKESIDALDELEERWLKEGGQKILNALNKEYADK